MRSRNWVSGLAVPIVAAIAVGRRGWSWWQGANNGSGPASPRRSAAGYPPARRGHGGLHRHPPRWPGRGIQATPPARSRTSGRTIVAVGGAVRRKDPPGHGSTSRQTTGPEPGKLGTVPRRPVAPARPPHWSPGGRACGWIAVGSDGPSGPAQNARDWVQSPLSFPSWRATRSRPLTATRGPVPGGRHQRGLAVTPAKGQPRGLAVRQTGPPGSGLWRHPARPWPAGQRPGCWASTGAGGPTAGRS